VAQSSAHRSGPVWSRVLGREPDAFGLIAPAYIIYLLFILGPAVSVLLIGFTDARLGGGWHWIGLENFERLATDPTAVRALLNTLMYTIGTIVPSLIVGMALAVALNSTRRLMAAVRLGFYLPNVIGLVAASVAFLWIFDPAGGLLNKMLGLIGVAPQSWLFNPDLALPSMMAVGIWRLIGFNMIIYLAALKAVPRDLQEAALVDGAAPRQVFFRVTLPLIQPTTFFLVVMGVIQGFQVFDQIYVMTQGGPANSTTTLVHQVYLQAFFYQELGFAAALASVLLLIVLALTLVNFRFGSGRMGGY
jgi:multiple sugar transport system permease protein/raffinose/stachyose/melibiose transport system permease protein